MFVFFVLKFRRLMEKFSPKSIIQKTIPIVVKIISNLKKIISNIF